MSLSEHEKNYTPSEWSKRYGPMELLARFFKFSQNVTSQVRSCVNHEQDIPYGSTERTKYDIYGTDLPNDAPIFVFIHGGYWQEFSKDLAGFPVTALVSKGIKVVISGYDLCPSVTLSEIVSQIKLLTEKILKVAQDLGSKSVWIAGHSAGAHLAASILYDKKWFDLMIQKGYSNLLKGLLLISGIYGLKPLLSTSFNDAVKLTKDEIEKLSFAPIEKCHLRDKEDPMQNIKVILTVGEWDSPIFIEETRRYSKRLVGFVDNVEFVLLRDIDHFDIVENLTKNDFVLTKLILHNILST